jgi:hypothetical protein
MNQNKSFLLYCFSQITCHSNRESNTIPLVSICASSVLCNSSILFRFLFIVALSHSEYVCLVSAPPWTTLKEFLGQPLES